MIEAAAVLASSPKKGIQGKLAGIRYMLGDGAEHIGGGGRCAILKSPREGLIRGIRFQENPGQGDVGFSRRVRLSTDTGWKILAEIPR